MRTEIQTVRIGENMGPVDWLHPTAADMPAIWRLAELAPDGFLFQGRMILAICMYDGWPYWEPRPAIQFVGPLNSAEWTFFDSYSVRPEDIRPRDNGRRPEGQDGEAGLGRSPPEWPSEETASPKSGSLGG